jgi:voltage-gated potassium channel
LRRRSLAAKGRKGGRAIPFSFFAAGLGITGVAQPAGWQWPGEFGRSDRLELFLAASDLLNCTGITASKHAWRQTNSQQKITGINVAQQNWGFNLALMGVLFIGLFLFKDRFTRRTVVASVLLSLISIFAILAYGTFGSYLLRADFRPPIPDLGTAFYFTIVTLSTVGYGDIVPDKPETQWFVISLLVVGLSVFASAIASVLGPTISGELDRIFKPKESKVEPKDHVILVGQGAIARNTAQELKRRGVPFVQIVAGQGEPPEGDHRVIEGDPTDDAVLCEAGIQQARMVIAAGEDDGENAFIALVAKDLNPNVRMLALASSALVIRRLKLARADLVFSPAAVGSRLLADLVEGIEISPEFQDLLEGRTGTGR